MKREDLMNWTRGMLEDKILKQEELIEQWKCDIGELSVNLDTINKENNSLKCENQTLKQRIKDLEDVCDGSCFFDEEDDRDKMIAKLKDQHQQDCIRINDLTTTVHVLAGLYSTLRKNVRID